MHKVFGCNVIDAKKVVDCRHKCKHDEMSEMPRTGIKKLIEMKMR